MSAPYETPPPYLWWGWDDDCTCNLCHLYAPHRRGDERLLELEPFTRFVSVASAYRDRQQGLELVAEWARRHGGDLVELIAAAELG